MLNIFLFFKPLEPFVKKIVRILNKRLAAGIFKHYDSPYRNPWFLIKKSTPGKFRMINVATHINKMIIRDSNILPNIKKFVKNFAEM